MRLLKCMVLAFFGMAMMAAFAALGDILGFEGLVFKAAVEAIEKNASIATFVYSMLVFMYMLFVVSFWMDTRQVPANDINARQD